MHVMTWWPLASAILHILVQTVLVLRLLMRRQPLANTHAWLLLVLFLPIAGVILYLLIGENRLGVHRLKRANASRAALEHAGASLWALAEQHWTPEEDRFRHLAHLGANLCHTPAIVGNDLELLHDAETTLARLIADIDAAQSTCHVLTFIFQPNGEPLKVVDALIRAAQRGVTCRLALDGAGSRSFLRSHHPRRLRHAGVHVVELLPVRLARLPFARIDLRNHRKICVIDHHIAYCGSQNITDSTFKPPGSHAGPWIDATVRMVGPAARALDLVFAADWNADAPDQITEPFANAPPPQVEHATEPATVQLLPSGPGQQPRAIQSAIVTTIYAAREELIMTTPYFAPDQTVLAALIAAADRGVDVTLVVPAKGDKRLVAAAGRAAYADLLDAGVRIMLYKPGLLHAKTITVDRDVALIGSANLDRRSFWINFEVTTAIYDTDFASQLRRLQRTYIHHADPVDAKTWSARTAWTRLKENIAQLMSPLL
ncbi:MAG: cardiolipin synthase [Phycisphaerales bacterium]|nr:cardiolipin synthase [Phycisphaerales bacterium]